MQRQTSYKKHTKLRNGFTVLDVVLVLIILSILGGITYPLYTEHLIRARRLAAISALQVAACYMETYYAENHTYRLASLEHVLDDNLRFVKDYHLSIVHADDISYVLQAIPVGRQVRDLSCGLITLDNIGILKAHGNTETDVKCWL